MTDPEPRSGEELIDEEGRNPTQRQIDEGGPEAADVDESSDVESDVAET